jgi:hypothetical protein
MSDAVLASAVTAAAGVVVASITGVLGYRSARRSLRKELDVDLRRQRLDAFKALWRCRSRWPNMVDRGRPPT